MSLLDNAALNIFAFNDVDTKQLVSAASSHAATSKLQILRQALLNRAR